MNKMPDTETPYEGLQIEINILSKQLSNLSETTHKNRIDLKQRISKAENTVANLANATLALNVVMKEQQAIFKKAMLWIVASFAAMHYDQTAAGLKMILGKPKEVSKPDEDTGPNTRQVPEPW